MRPIGMIGFRAGNANPEGSFSLWPQGPFAISAELEDADLTDELGGVSVHRHPDSSLSNTVIFPITQHQRNGLEDLRLVRLDHGNGDFEWVGTYTAYSGSSIRSELLRTRDFCSFNLEPMRGEAGRDKGMALFPERVNGLYTMIGRQDGKNLFLMQSENLSEWNHEGSLLMEPRYPWELIAIGNCGSPIPTSAGWLLLTHGVGAMRKYALGCALLDIGDPPKVIARSREPILTAENADRSGYVPDVVYTCGAMRTGDHLLIPYGISDSAAGFATARIDDLLNMMG